MNKLILKNLSFSFLERFWQLFTSLIVIRLFASHFNVSQFADYQYVIALLSIASSITWILPLESMYSQVRKNNQIPQKIFFISLVSRLIFSTLVYLVFIISSISINAFTFKSVLILILGISLIHTESAGLLKFQLEVKGKFIHLTLFRMFSSALKLLLIFMLFLYKTNIYLIMLILPFEQLLNTIFYWNFFKKRKIPKIHFSLFKIKSLIAKGFNFWLGLILMYAFLRFDRIYYIKKITDYDFATYSAAASLNDQIVSIVLILINSFAPALIYKSHINDIKIIIKNLIYFFVPLSLLAVIILNLFSYDLIKILYNNKYSESNLIFNKFIYLLPLIFLDSLLSTYLFKHHLDGIFLRKWFISLIISITTTAVLFPLVGVSASILGMALGYFTGILTFIFYYKNKAIKYY